MPVARHFLGWDAPLTERVGAWLLPAPLDGPADLQADLVVVPTRQAGRRLREALARRCAAQQTALLAGRVVTPAALFAPGAPPDAGAAAPAQVAAAWAAVLQQLDPRAWRALFPAPPPERTLDWALRLGARLQQLRETLAEGGWRLADVPAAAGDALEEPERWQELAQLEAAYLRALAGAGGGGDPCVRKLRLAAAPELPPDVRRIVVAGVPDPSGLALRALDRLARHCPVEILIHAPAELADQFDAWGRPLSEHWTRRPILIPEPERNIRTAVTPAGQAAAVVEVMRDEVRIQQSAVSSRKSENSSQSPEVRGQWSVDIDKPGAARDAAVAAELAASLAVGAPDAALLPYLETALERAGVTTFDPAARPLSGTGLYQAIAALCRLHTDGTYAAFSRAVRQADVLDYLRRQAGVDAADWLAELDDFHSRHLPPSWPALRQQVFAQQPQSEAAGMPTPSAPEQVGQAFLADQSVHGGQPGMADLQRRPEALSVSDADQADQSDRSDPPYNKVRSSPLARVIPAIEALLAPLGQADPAAGVRQMLMTLYGGCVLPAGAPATRQFAAAAAAVDEVLHEVAALPAGLCAGPGERLALLLQRLAETTVEPLPVAAAVDLEGWLELPWNDAPLMIVTGLNEGRVPESQCGDLFLPDSLRHNLGLRNNESRYARDAFLLSGLLAARENRGRVVLISGRATAEGDPLKPSRLLFRCPDAELAGRARRLLGAWSAAQRGSALAEAGFKLNPCPGAERVNVPAGTGTVTGSAPEAGIRRKTAAFLQQPLAVTAFRDYLACPFRFYLKRLLGMAALDDQATSLDAGGFGELLHAALQRVLLRPDRRACADEELLAGELCRAAAAYARGRWGPRLAPLLALQLEIAQQRLRAAARIQAELARAGWEIRGGEQPFTCELDGVTLRARVDRLDRHRASGAWRLVDYKTTDQGYPPADAHLARPRADTPAYALTPDGKRRWTDLQLPLYLRALPAAAAGAELAYFNLPKAGAESGLAVWEDFTPALRQSAENCARGVLADIRAGRFWPPAERVAYDDFERLFTAAPEECFDAAQLGGQ